MRLKKGDRVVVLKGKDKGREGVVMRVLPKDDKVIVEGVNIAKKHQKQTRATMQAGIIEKDMPIDASNVAIISQRQAEPHRLPHRGRRHEGPHRHADRGGAVDDVPQWPSGPRLKARYHDEVQAQLKEELGLANVMQVPRLEKIVVNMGVGRATQQPSLLEGAVADLTIISGQKPIVTKAGRSIAGFKLREGQSIGAKVTLRGDRMWEFLDRLISIAIPRIRDFRGLPANSFDGRGNYTFGVTEQLIFPEIDYDRVDTTRGMDITIVTTAADDAGGRALLEAFGWPFKRGEDAMAPTKERRRGPVRGGKGAKGGKKK